MSPRSDNSGVTPRRRLDARTADALLAGRVVAGEEALTGLIAELRVLPEAPVPNAALSAMLESGLTPAVVPLPERNAPRVRRTWALPLQIALGTSACVALVLGAAATGELPDPAQTAVADVVEAVTPLHVPRPVTHPPVPAVVPSPTQSAQPAADQTNADQPGDGPHSQPPRPSASPDDHRGSGSGSTGDGGDHQDGGRPSASPSSGRGDHSGGGTSGGSSGDGSSGSSGSGSSGSGTSSPDGSDDNGTDPSGGHDGSGGSGGSSTGGSSSDDSHLSGSSSDQ